jgi:anaphase-promoting complex subunit 10
MWTLSSSKQGNGVEQLKDDHKNTFWQSDNIQPHFLKIEYLKNFRINELWIYLDYKTDESYTPNRISIQIENSFNEWVEYKLFRFDEPVGWHKISFEEINSKGEVIKPYIKTQGIQMIILQNMHNGKDTHVRCVKIFSPREHKSYDLTNPKFATNDMTQFECLR